MKTIVFQFPIHFMLCRYGVKSRPETSGLYLFIPDGDAVPLDAVSPFVKIVKGKFMSYVEVWLHDVKHRVTLYNHPGRICLVLLKRDLSKSVILLFL